VPDLDPAQDIEQLETIRRELAVWSLQMTTRAGSGHPSTSLSASHIVTALYFGGILKVDPEDPEDPDRDRFIMSKGHGVPILYAALAERGYFPSGWLLSLREIGSPLEGHPNMRRVPGIEASTGSLGQGLSLGLGQALAARVTGNDYNVFVMTGDGELDQGQVWEAAAAAAKYDVSNLVAIVDRNGYQQTGAAADVLPLEPLADKWRAFGWEVARIDGHDWEAVLSALRTARAYDRGPFCVIADTVKGYGVSVIEGDPGNKFHGVPLKPEQLDQAIDEVLLGRDSRGAAHAHR
jgi:transketolase